jgi:prephenate dehydrogenase
MNRLVVLGFGLIGGSLGLAARKSGWAEHVTAVDLAAALDREACERAADERIEVGDERAVVRALESSTLTVLATPVSVICERVAFALQHAPLVTDCGSTKRRVVAAAQRSARFARFVPGHPMAGFPDGGIENASADLFRGRNWILCDESADHDAVATVRTLVEGVGALRTDMSANEHDAAVARTSHLPQLLASALSVTAEARNARRAAGPAFERATQTAGGPESVWRDIFASNGDEVARAFEELLAELVPVALELERGGVELAAELLARARQLRAASRKDLG